MIATCVITVRPLYSAMEMHEHRIPLGVRALVTIGKQEPVVHNEIIHRPVLVTQVPLLVRTGVPPGHILIGVGLHSGRALPKTEGLVLLQIIIVRRAYPGPDIQCTIGHTGTVLIIAFDLGNTIISRQQAGYAEGKKSFHNQGI